MGTFHQRTAFNEAVRFLFFLFNSHSPSRTALAYLWLYFLREYAIIQVPCPAQPSRRPGTVTAGGPFLEALALTLVVA